MQVQMLKLKTDKQSTPLHLAARMGHTEAVKALLEIHANIEALGDKQRTPLHLAALWGYAGVIRALIEAGANIKAQDDEQATPLYLAAKRGCNRSNQCTYYATCKY